MSGAPSLFLRAGSAPLVGPAAHPVAVDQMLLERRPRAAQRGVRGLQAAFTQGLQARVHLGADLMRNVERAGSALEQLECLQVPAGLLDVLPAVLSVLERVGQCDGRGCELREEDA